MKRLVWLFVILAFVGNTKAQLGESVTAEDSLLKVLSTQPEGSARLATLYSLACLDQMAPSCIHYLGQLWEEAKKQNDKEHQCRAMYGHVIYYFNHQDEENMALWMNRLSEMALEQKYYNWYFPAKRAEITMHIVKRKIEYSITEAEKMYELARKLNYTQGMSDAKLCLMSAYMMTARYKEGEEAGFEAYRLLPSDASWNTRKGVLQEITLACSFTEKKDFLEYLREYEKVLLKVSQEDYISQGNSYLLLESLYTEYYLKAGKFDEACRHLKNMDKYFSPTAFIPCRGLYYDVYSHYYKIAGEYDKALLCADSAISLLSGISDNGGINYEIKRAGILAAAERFDEAIPLYQGLLAQKDSFYKELSVSQMDEIYRMRNMDSLLLEKEQHKTIIHGIILIVVVIALLILIPSIIRIYKVRKKLKQEEEEIRQMTLIAEEANEVKTRFLSDMSYNIRIPLNNVLGFSQLMTMDANEIDANQWKVYSEIIQSNSTELIQLVNDVLDLSRLEAGRTKWKIEEYDAVLLCTEVIGMAEMRNEGKIRINFQSGIEKLLIQVDVARLSQVLLSALTYSDPCEEEREISFFLQKDGQEKEMLVFQIENSPLADPRLQTQKVEVRHSINRLTVGHLGGKYAVNSDVMLPTITFTYPVSRSN